MRIPLGSKCAVTTRGLRRGVQLVVFGLFVYLTVMTTENWNTVGNIPPEFFLHTSPLVGAAAMLASRTLIDECLIIGGIVVLITVLFGRLYCGWFCPFGTFIDIMERLLYRKRRPATWTQARSDRWRAVKYVILACALGAAVFSYQPLLFLDPISTAHRTVAIAVEPPATTLTNEALGELYRPLAARGIRVRPGEPRFGRTGLIALSMVVGIIALSAVQRRFWCRYLCPLGGFFALLTWRPLIRRKVADSCVHCRACERGCKMGCIYGDGDNYRSRECITCYECEVCCPPKAVSFAIARGLAETEAGMDRQHQLTRRRALSGLAFGAGWLALMKASPSGLLGPKRDRLKNPKLVRPPASMPEDRFLDLCARCGECVRVCPTNTIQPALWEAGPEGLFTPILVARIAECKESCNACGSVCPTGAIQEFLAQDKNPRLTRNPVIVGVATIDRSRCRPWYLDKACSICDEQCPYDAIASPVIDGLKRPFVIERFCAGCGSCERECPMEPGAAITVTNRIEKRPVLDAADRAYYDQPDTESADSAWRRVQGRNILSQQDQQAEGTSDEPEPPAHSGAGHGQGRHGGGGDGGGGGGRGQGQGQGQGLRRQRRGRGV